MYWKTLARELGIPEAAIAAMEALEPAPRDALDRPDRYAPEDPRGLRRLKTYLTLARDTREQYARLGIPDSVFLASFQDFPIWCRDYAAKHGAAGVSELSWLARTVRCGLFRLGRLQFEPLVLEKALGGHAAGTPVLEVHIPAEAPLEPEAVLASFAQAPGFFRRHFAAEYSLCHCHSWLLSPALQEILPADSRILRFQSLFDVVDTDQQERQAEERVFGFVSDDPAAYPGHTSLQRAMKDYLLRGGALSMGQGLRRL